MTMNKNYFLNHYLDTLAKRGITPDPGQMTVLHHLAARAEQLTRPKKLLSKATVPGLYLAGEVGRGKTMLMDLFFDALPETITRQRMHFHAVMQAIHQALFKEAGKNPLPRIVNTTLGKYQVICWDECQVDDVADALILKQVFECIFKQGICLIMTSNTLPRNLYQNGVQRHLFLKAIDALEAHSETLSLTGGQDYRVQQLATHQKFFLGPQDNLLQTCFEQLATGEIKFSPVLYVHDRTLQARAQAHHLIWFDFSAICEGPRGVADYFTLAQEAKVWLLSDVPVLDESNVNATRRFIHLIDILYDSGCQLLLSAAAPIDQIFQGTTLRQEFGRTQSRLNQMLSA